jgi:hypothetical protein
MIPTNSSNSTNGCDSISSNCVIWQGPDISCIELCNGDTITDVTAQLAQLVCDLIADGVTANPNLTGLDISCLNVPGVTPTTLVPVLQAMVNAICADNAATDRFELPIMTLPACLVYNDALGNPVTQLPLDQFATLIATRVCSILTAITTINTTLSNHNTRITVLEACVLPCTGTTAETQVVPTCIINVGNLTNVSVLLLALEVRFCALETAVGLPAAINAAIGQGACILSTTPTLANSAVSYGSIPGWNNTPVNLAQSTQNIWAVLCDLYSAVESIQLNCCPSGCASVTFGYNTTNVLSGSTGVIAGLNFNFQNTTGTGSVIPATFNDCAGSTVITIRDINNVAITSTVSVATLQNSAGGVTITLPGLNTYGPLTTSVAFCVTDGRDTCSDTIVKSVTGIIPCPTPTMSAITSSGATVTFTNALGPAVVYIIDIINDTTNVVVATYTQNSPGPTVTNAFTGLIAGTLYRTRVTVQAGGQTQVCTAITFTTASSAAPCSAGLDVVFVLDYSSSMSATITGIKTGIPSTISTIQAASGANDYRLGLVLADEGSAAGPTYATSVDYLALPTSQRVINTGVGSKFQFITAVELMAPNNATSFTTQLNKIDTGAAPTNWPIGQGGGIPEPTDMAIGFVVESNAFAGVFRTGVAKYLLIYTDALPSGDDDIFDIADVIRLNSLVTTCLTNGIKCFVLGTGNNKTYTPVSGTTTYPWRDFATATGGAWDVSFSTAAVNALITNGCATP